MHGLVDSGLALYEQPHSVRSAVLGRDVQRGGPVLSGLVDSGLALDEQPRSVRLALLGRGVQRGGPVLLSLVNSGLALDEQPRSVRVALPGCDPQRCLSLVITIGNLPVDRCFDFNQSLGFFRVSAFTGIVKFLGDWRNARSKVRSVRVCVAGAASYLCLAMRSRGAAHAGGNAYPSKLFLLCCKLITLRLALA